MPQRPRVIIGIGLMAAAVFFFACLDAGAKWLARDLPVVEVVWARYAFNLLLILPLVNPWRIPGLLKSKRPGVQISRAALTLCSTLLNVLALRYLQLDQTVSIMFSTPLIVALLAGPILGEWVGPRRLIAIIVGFLGVLVVTRPGFEGFHPAMLLTAGGALIYATGNIQARILAQHDRPETALFLIAVIGTLGTTPFLPAVWVTPTGATPWLVMVGIGAAGAAGHWCLINAHVHAPASRIAPFIYTQIIWMIGLGHVLFEDVPDLPTIIGACIVVASGLYLLWRERVVVGEVKSAPERS